MNLRWKSAFLVMVLGLSGCATPKSKETFQPTPPQARLVQLMAQRLDIARQVAWIKYQSHLPVKDPKREAALLDSLTKQGQAVGLPATEVRSFFAAQIDASCQVQEHLIRKWQRGATLPTYPPLDLKKDIRPRLDVLSAEMLAKLRQAGPFSPALEQYAYTSLKQAGFTWRMAGTAAAPLK